MKGADLMATETGAAACTLLYAVVIAVFLAFLLMNCDEMACNFYIRRGMYIYAVFVHLI